MSPRKRFTRRTAVIAALALLSALLAAAARGDDRELLHKSTADPYLFILLDTSGSMNWSPKDDASCPTGDCFVPFNADDPGSKAYQAKQALYRVLTSDTFPKVNLGFATYNQDQLGVLQKHWMYQAAADGISLGGGIFFPAVGAKEVFGNLWTCTGSGDSLIGCDAADPADLTDIWELTRARRFPKGGLSFSSSQTFYIRSSGTTYKVTYTPSAGSYGSNLTVSVAILKCTNGSCSSTTAVAGSPKSVIFTPVSDFLSWDNGADRNNPQLGYFTQGVASDSIDQNTCSGWDASKIPADDTGSDKYPSSSGYNLRFPNLTADPRGDYYMMGDVIPMDWNNDHKVDILKRLSPNFVDTSTVPDFRIAPYLANNRGGSDTFLRLKDESRRPLIFNGSTPIGNSFKQFRSWYGGCTTDTACKTLGGWAGVAAAQDSSFQCRQKYILILTDGDETCSGDPCKYADLLKTQYGVTTFVVAFGVANTPGNQLSCMGDSKHVFFPKDQAELIAAIENALDQIKEQSSAFASAAVPSVQAEAADTIYLSSFTPVDKSAYWDGHVNAFLKPVPLANGKPDLTRKCSASVQSECHLWDAGVVLKSQAPTAADIGTPTPALLTEGTLRLGLADTQRRIFYSKAGTNGVLPTPMRMFSPPPGDPTSDPDWSDLFKGFNFQPAPATAAEKTAAKSRANDIFATSLAVKDAKVGVLETPISFILGDVFHSNPVLADRPNEFAFFSGNLYAKASATDCTSNPGYQCYAQKHRYRRRILVVGSDDGQLHAFDAGIWRNSVTDFDSGTGKELFAYVPRLAMPIVRDLAEGGHQIFGVDGTPRVEDVFIDPLHTAGTAVATDREWRTVVVGGFREGGDIDSATRVGDFVSGYYALDITQPDKLDSANKPINENLVPGCLSTANSVVSGCGTLPFPSTLWEFTDALATSRLDEDRNGFPDLGQTWSVPTVGRIRVIEGGTPVDKFVAIFGGGMDADNKLSPKRGNWLYIVDIETGQAIYKRKLVGAAVGDPAVLDTDLDAYLDTIYVATTAGFLYKASIGSAGTLQDVTVTTTQALPNLVANTAVKRITDTSWDPFPIFDTIGKPIYLAPTAFFVSRLNRFAITFGSGDRENLWNMDALEGRFYVIVDDGFTSGMVPKTELNYTVIDSLATDSSPGSDFVNSPAAGKSRGWVLTLDPNERVITQSFGLAGILIFSTYIPTTSPPDAEGLCARGGTSNIFVVFANNANGVMSVSGTTTKFRGVPVVVTNPYVEQGSTKNPSPTSGTSNAGQLDATQKQIMDALKKNFPKSTKFANYWIRVSGVGSDTSLVSYGTIPVGLREINWKEN